jgi:hypothetical protein
MTVPSSFRKTELVAVRQVMEESEKPSTPDGVEIRHLLQKIVIPGRPYSESLIAQISEVSLFAKFLLSAFRAPRVIKFL